MPPERRAGDREHDALQPAERRARPRRVALSERRIFSADGATAFFTSPERLLDADTNGKFDVYMWDEGDLDLVSTGQSSDNSAFVDASADGDDAFFLTRQQLVGIDTDNYADMYDARVGGGIASRTRRPRRRRARATTARARRRRRPDPPAHGSAR